MCMTFDVHTVPGFVDLIVRIPTKDGPILQMVEVKTEDGPMEPHQETLRRVWGGFCVQVIRTQRDVMFHVEQVQARHPPRFRGL